MENKKKKYRILVRATIKKNGQKIAKVYRADTQKEGEKLAIKDKGELIDIQTSFLENAHVDHYLNFNDRL